MQGINYIKKITISEIGYDKKGLQKLTEAQETPVEVARVLANITGSKIETSKLDNAKAYTRFTGVFEVTNCTTGEVFNSTQIILPSVAESYLAASIQAAEDSGAVLCAITITVQKDESKNSATGYKFGLIVHTDKQNSDPFASLRNLLTK